MIAALVLLACSGAPSDPGPEAHAPPAPQVDEADLDGEVTIEPVDGAPGPARERTYAFELEQARYRLAQAEKRVAVAPGSYRAHLGLMSAHESLGRLKGGLTEHDLAWEAWRAAAAISPDDARVKRAEAGLLQAEHRFRDALKAIEGLETREDKALRASIRFELGEYELAVTELTALLDAEKDPSTAARLANVQWKLGRFDEAERWMGVAQQTYHGREQWVVAWHHLMLGLMDLSRERYDDALVHYQDAEAAYPGWWLVQEHIAEIHAAQGHPEQALPIYEAVVGETESPELMGALADTLDALGRKDEASVWRAKALAGFEAQLVSNPTSAGGHALEFLLEHGDPARSLVIARENVALRPNGEAKLLLAEALEHTGDAAGGKALRDEVAASGWWVGP